MQELPIAKHVASVIRAQLDARGMTQRDLCIHAGFIPSAMSKRINGQLEFSLSELARIAKALDTTVAELCAYPSDRPADSQVAS